MNCLLCLRSGRVGMVTVFVSVLRTEKLLGLWRGVSPVSITPDLVQNLYYVSVCMVIFCISVSAVVCALYSRSRHLLQHIFHSKAALLRRWGPGALTGHTAGSRSQMCRRSLHAAHHCHQNTLRGVCVCKYFIILLIEDAFNWSKVTVKTFVTKDFYFK